MPQRLIYQGDIYWARVVKAGETEALVHPHVVLQNDLFNQSRIETVVVCALTSNPRRINEPGNILLNPGEANLPKASIVVVSQLASIKKCSLGEYIGTLSPERVEQILAGLRFQQRACFER